MQIVTKPEGNKLTLALDGRLDTVTAPQLDEAAKAIAADVKDIVLDFSKLEYISSAGLRSVLALSKLAKGRSGSLAIAGANDSVKKVFEITGLAPLLNFV